LRGCQAIVRDKKNGVYWGASEMCKDGTAIRILKKRTEKDHLTRAGALMAIPTPPTIRLERAKIILRNDAGVSVT